MTALETFRCPTCLYVLTESGQRRCPACHKRLRRRGRPIVLGDKTGFGGHEPIHIDLALAERLEVEREAKLGHKQKSPETKTPEIETPTAKTVKTKPVKTKRVKTKRVKTKRVKTKRGEPLVASVAAAVEAQLVDGQMLDTPPVVSVPPASEPFVAAPAVSEPEPVSAPVVSETVMSEPVVEESDGIEHTTIFAPSQFDPEMRQTLDSLYRKARSEIDDYDKKR